MLTQEMTVPAPRPNQIEMSAPDPLKETLFHVFDLANARVYDAVSKAVSEKLRIIPRHYAMLCVLSTRTDVNQQDLADLVGVNRNAMVQLIDQLEQLGLAKRSTNPQNRREHRVALSEKGRRTLDQARQIVKEATDDATGVLSNAERNELKKLLGRIAFA